jgi:hypothetical protein
MKRLFLIFAKLLGLFQLYTALMSATQLVVMLTLMTRSEPAPLVGLLLGAVGLLLFLAVSLAIARILIVQTEWLAEKVGIRDDAPVAGLEHGQILAVGICLIGIFVTVESLPDVVRLVLSLRKMSANGAMDYLWPQLLPSVLPLALGLFLALKPEAVARRVGRSSATRPS